MSRAQFENGTYRGLLYRALNPVYAREPLSGEGAKTYGGRFNRIGKAALYTSLNPDTAIREANQVGTLQPTTLVALQADIRPVFDTRDAQALALYDMTADKLGDPGWREAMLSGCVADTVLFAERLAADDYAGLLVASFAKGATARDLNLVLWEWDESDARRLSVVDDERRLG